MGARPLMGGESKSVQPRHGTRGFVPLNVDIPAALKDRLVRGAVARQTTLRAYVEWLLYNGLGHEEQS